MSSARGPVELVLAGALSYDAVSADHQARVREGWNTELARRLATLDRQTELDAGGLPYAVADAQGRTTWRQPRSR